MSWSFTLKSFAAIYAEMHDGVDAGTFARRLWGDVYYQPKTRGLRSMAKMAVLGSTARHRRLFRGLTPASWLLSTPTRSPSHAACFPGPAYRHQAGPKIDDFTAFDQQASGASRPRAAGPAPSCSSSSSHCTSWRAPTRTSPSFPPTPLPPLSHPLPCRPHPVLRADRRGFLAPSPRLQRACACACAFAPARVQCGR